MIKKKINLYIIISIVLFSLDRLTKYLALNFIKFYKNNSGFIKLKLLLNRGISFGILNCENKSIFISVTLFVMLITFFILIYTINRFKKGYMIWGELILLIGSISNIVDRLLYYGVIDFISINIFYLPSAFFNLADIFILIGAAIIFFNTKDG